MPHHFSPSQSVSHCPCKSVQKERILDHPGVAWPPAAILHCIRVHTDPRIPSVSSGTVSFVSVSWPQDVPARLVILVADDDGPTRL